ncbi:hypothetical protein MHYP_G00156710 [Metynnis hypsauchen]
MVCRVCTGFSNLGEVAVCEGQRYEGTVASLSVPKGLGGSVNRVVEKKAQRSPPSPGKEGRTRPPAWRSVAPNPHFCWRLTLKEDGLKRDNVALVKHLRVEKETKLVVEEDKTEAQGQGKEEKRLAKLWRKEQRMLKLKRKSRM